MKKFHLVVVVLAMILVGCSPAAFAQAEKEVVITAVAEDTPVDGIKCESGCDLKQILAADVKIDSSGGIDAFTGGEGRSLGEIYYSTDTALTSDAVNPGGVHFEDGHYNIAGYYQAPNGKWYRVASPVPEE